MSNLFGHKAASVTQQVYTGIQVSTSMLGNAIPLMYGMNRGTGNLLWYGYFKATQGKSPGKGGGGGGSGSYTYSAAWAAALCEGPITGIGQIWHDRAIVTLAWENLTLFLGLGGQPAWTVPPAAQQIPYDHIAYVATPAYDLQGSASMPNLAYEIKALLYNTGPPGPQFGGIMTGDLASASNVINNVSPPGALAVGSILSDSAGAIPSATTVTAINTGVSTSNTGCTITMSNPASSQVSGDSITYTIIGTSAGDADPSLVIPDYLTDPNHGAGYIGTIASLAGNNNYQGYCWALGIGVSPVETTQRQASDFLTELMQITNSEIVESAGTLKIIPYCDATVSGNGYTYNPASTQLTPLYSFSDDDYLVESEDEDPVELIRTPLAKTYNMIVVEFLDRANSYNTAPVPAFDLDDINANGLRLAPTYTFHQITNANTAKLVASLLLQASLYRRNSYKFKVRFDYCLLECMDPIAISDASLGLTAQLCWITEITRSGENELTITALEVTGIANTVPQYNWGSAQGYAQNYNASPGSVAAPYLFMLPPNLASSSGSYALGIAVCGQTQNAGWAGCQVLASLDGGSTYQQVGVITAPARYGVLGANFASGSDPDTANTLNVVLQNSTQTIAAGTNADADAMQTLILIGGSATAPEVIAYSAATMASAGVYNLGTYLRRGQYQTGIAAHASGTPWVRMDGAIFELDIDPGWLGTTIYLKFLSFNTFGQALENAANVTAYPYTLAAGALGTALAVVTTGSAIAYDYHVAKAVTGASAWDSCVYSKMSFAACSASFRPQSAGQLMLGLSATPTASSSYTNADYALFPTASAGALQIYESGSLIGTFGTYSLGDLLAVTYDGANVRYFHNGALLRTVPRVGYTPYLFIPIATPGVVASDVTFTQITQQQNNLTWIPRTTSTYAVAVSGNSLQSTGSGSPAFGTWDAYTQQQYQNGCSFSCRWISGGAVAAGIATGLSGSGPIDPNTNLGFYLWYPHADSTAIQVIDNGSVITVASRAPLATDIFSITYDGYYVRWFLNGVLMYTSAPAPGLAFAGYVTGFRAFGDSVGDLYLGANPQATPWGWEPTGTCLVADSSCVKNGGSNAWDSGAFTIAGYKNCSVQGKPSTTGVDWMMGLATNPSASVSYANINYAWYMTGGTWDIYESGANIGAFATAAVTDIAGVTYDGTNIKYWLNGAVMRTVPVSGLTLFGQVALYEPGAQINSLEFSSSSTLPLSDTGQIGQNAATATFLLSDDTLQGPVNTNSATLQSLYSYAAAVPYVPSPVLTFTPTVSETGIVTVTTHTYLQGFGNPSSTVASSQVYVEVLDTTAGTVAGVFPQPALHSLKNVNFNVAYGTTTSPVVPLTIQGEIALTAGHSYAVYLLCAPAFQTGSVYYNQYFMGTYSQVEVIKR